MKLTNRINPRGINQLYIFGCGGTGSHVAAGLARLEIAVRSLGGAFPTVILCDPDTVETPNVGRQLFSPCEIGMNKASALAERMNFSYGLCWKAQDTDSFHGDMNLICVDSRKARKTIYANAKLGYYMDFGNTNSTGQVIIGGGTLRTRDPKRGYWRERSHFPLPAKQFPQLTDLRFKDGNVPSCSLAEALESQELFVNQMVATYGLQMLWRIFRHGELACHGYFINLDGSAVAYHIK